MAIRFIRKPSDTPNINNRDDFIFLRYAYGNQNGYIKNFGTELGYEINGNIFKITSGRVNLQGIVSEVDSAGVDIVIDNVAGTRFFTVYYEVNLALQTTSIKSLYDNAVYPSVSAGDDLTQNSAGIARLELYRFKVVDNIISNVVKVVKAVEYFNEEIDYRLENKASFYAGTDNQLDSNYPTGTTLFCDLKYADSNIHFESDFYYNAKAYLFLKTNGYEVIAINDFYAKTLAYKEHLKIDKNYRRLGGTWRSRGTTTIYTESPRGLFQRVADETEEMPPEYGE